MRPELPRPEETLTKTPDSIFIIGYPATFGGIGDIVALATVADRLQRAGIKQVGLGYKDIEAQRQVVSLVHSPSVDFQPLPEKLFDPNLSGPDRLRYFRRSREFINRLKRYARIALLGAREVRFLKKSLLRFKLDVFPRDVFWEDELLMDNYASQLGERYGVIERLDHKPVELSIDARHQTAVEDWARVNELNLKSPFWVINLRTGNPAKTWPPERFFALGKWLRQKTEIPIVLINLPVGFRHRQSLRETTRSWACLFDSAEIGEAAALIKEARGYIGGDTGITHITAALGTPLAIIYPEINLRVWKPVTRGQEMVIVSGETIESITCNQVMEKLEARPDFFRAQNRQP